MCSSANSRSLNSVASRAVLLWTDTRAAPLLWAAHGNAAWPSVEVLAVPTPGPLAAPLIASAPLCVRVWAHFSLLQH